jgi:hypothetical protein
LILTEAIHPGPALPFETAPHQDFLLVKLIGFVLFKGDAVRLGWSVVAGLSFLWFDAKLSQPYKP